MASAYSIFTLHPDSIARRLREQRRNKARGRLRQSRAEKSETALILRKSPTSGGCPLDRSWRFWEMFGQERRYDRVSPEDKAICDQARRATPVRHLCLIELYRRVVRADRDHTLCFGCYGMFDPWRHATERSQRATG